ncbi:MAG: exo-alpha-sialidase [Planctomycetaceae bacterium]|nr:exo-alpha-sialidase [Planctomycetaceae bacterium]
MIHPALTRRAFLQSLAATGLGTVITSRSMAGNGPMAVIEERRVISWKPPLYHGWPTLTRRKNGELLLAFSGGREAHVCPFGRLELMRSKDNGRNWGWPQVIYDGPIDDRDAGVLETPQGSLLLTNFTSLAYVNVLQAGESIPSGQPKAWELLKLTEWRAAHHRLTEEQRQQELGMWMWRSTDGGVTWSARYAVPCHSPHGPIGLNDGRLLYLGINLWAKDRIVGAWESADDGLTWQLISRLPVRPGDDSANYHELHAVETNDGKFIAHIRNHNPQSKGETLQTESTDGGKSWSVPHSINVWGLPSHLLRLKDGRLLMSYSHRRAPFGNQARMSDDQGATWSEAITVSDDGLSGDLGYPSTVECDDGALVTVWYELLKGLEFAQLRQARWRLRS